MRFIAFHKKTYLLILLLIVFQSKSFGQDFKWVYSIIGAHIPGNYSVSNINNVLVDNQDNIYVLGMCVGQHDFSEGANTIVIDSESSYMDFIAKVDKNKNVLWVKFFPPNQNAGVRIANINLDHNQNLLLVGSAYHQDASFIDLDPDPGEQQTIVNPSALAYGIVVRLGPNGNYIDSVHSENFGFSNLTFDSNQNVIVVGTRTTNTVEEGYYTTAAIFKYDDQLNTIWIKELDGFSTSITDLVTDNQDNIILKGAYDDYLNFAGENLQKDFSLFICKLDPSSNEEWILELEYNNTTSVEGSVFSYLYMSKDNTIYMASRYGSENASYTFKNTTITGLPYEGNDDAILFNFDTNGNYISHISFSGILIQNITSFAISEFDEIILGLRTGGHLSLKNSVNEEIVSFTSEGEDILMKINTSHELLYYKEIDHTIKNLQFDSENNIISGSNFYRKTDFDPHPIIEYMLESNIARSGFVLKLSYCDSFPPTGDPNLIYCDGVSHTVADLITNEYNVSWYESLTSTIPLVRTTTLINGKTYYAAKNKIPNCPEIKERFAVTVTINPTPLAPILNAVQPCFSNTLKLEDLIIEGGNVAFFNNLTTTVKLNKATLISPDVVYFMSQTVQGCESERVPFSIPAQNLATLNDHTINLCDTNKNNSEEINLSNYISSLLNGNANDFTISYHNSQADALNNENPILDYQNYEANNQIIYIRFVYKDYSCFETATLTITLSSPPEITEIIVRDLTSNNSITVLPNNPNHLYSIDGINYQSSNEFQNIWAGEYTVYVKDTLEVCVEANDKVYVLTYPKFFTPNGDGYNDFWKIKYAVFQFSVDVEIYDRFGKLLASFNKNSPGWDGKLNGQELPSTDYWFKVTRISDKKTIHKGHFSLKR